MMVSYLSLLFQNKEDKYDTGAEWVSNNREYVLKSNLLQLRKSELSKPEMLVIVQTSLSAPL